MLDYTKFKIVFPTLMVLELVAEGFQFYPGVLILKPAVTICIILFFWSELKKAPHSFGNSVLIGLLFSLLGDVLLMFVKFESNFFIAGLGAFLFAHIFYIKAFISNIQSSNHSNPLSIKLLSFNPFLLFTLSMYALLRNDLGEMKIPVLAYMATITTMGVSAALRLNHTSTKSWKLVLAGAFLFIVSDGLIALNKFLFEIPYASLGIMSTYYAAQFLISTGSVEHLNYLSSKK